MAQSKVTKQQVLNHLARIAATGNKASIKFLINRRADIITEVWHDLEITAEQHLELVWGEIKPEQIVEAVEQAIEEAIAA